MYKNTTEGAEDAGDDLNNFIVDDLDVLCEGNDYFLESDIDRITSARDNINSTFMLFSEAYILLLMFVLMISVTIIIPHKMKEHHVPMLIRNAEENHFHVMMRIRCWVFQFYMCLSGCIPQITNYFTNKCLHTEPNPLIFQFFDVNGTDYYQFCMVSLIWFISLPISCFLIGAYFKDATRYSVIPCMITCVVFIVFAEALAFFTILNMMFNPNTYLVQATQGANIFVYLLCQILNTWYAVRWSKKDLLRTEEEEMEV